MPDSWFCARCGSMNRGQADRCYRCQEPKARAAFATARELRPDDALLPGTDKVDARRATALLEQPYSDPTLLGYLSVTLFTVLMATGLVALTGGIAMVLAAAAPDTFHVTDAMNRLVAVAAGVAGAASILAFICHGAFLGLTTRNVPALAGGKPRFEAGRAAVWWPEAYFWQIWASFITWILPGVLLLTLAFLVALGLRTLGLFGFVGMIAAIWSWGRYTGVRTDFPQHALETARKPARLLGDLTDRLEVPGSPGRRLVNLWSTSWVGGWAIRCFLPYLILGLYVAVIAAIVARALAGYGTGDLPSESQMARAATLFGLLLVLVALLADLLAVFFMARVTLALVDSQHGRRRWLLEAASGKAVVAAAAAQPAAISPRAATPVAQPAPPASGPVIGVVREAPPRTAPPVAAPPRAATAEPRPDGDRPKSRPDLPPGR